MVYFYERRVTTHLWNILLREHTVMPLWHEAFIVTFSQDIPEFFLNSILVLGIFFFYPCLLFKLLQSLGVSVP